MKIKKSSQRLTGISLSVLLSLVPLTAQTRRGSSPAQRAPAKQAVKEPVPTFDTLLAAESYKIYVEVRGVGQVIRSQGVNDLLDPIMKLAGPPKEFRTVVKWLEAQADPLMSSRLMFATWPTRQNLPKALVAIEFTSPEDARQFEPKLRAFLPKVVPTPSPSPHPSPSGPEKDAVTQSKTEEPPQLPYVIKHSGSLVVISDTQFSFRNLRPTGRKLMGEDQNFRLVRDRFTSEPIFLYFDVALEERAIPKPTPTPETVAAVHTEAPDSERSERTSESSVSSSDEFTVTQEIKRDSVDATPPSEGTITGEAKTGTLVAMSPESNQTDSAKLGSASASGPSPVDIAFMPLSRLLFGSRPSWPEVIGAAVAFDDDAYVLRALLINSPDKKNVPIPFVSQVVSGAALVPAAPSILPADTEMLYSFSLDLLQIHDNVIKTSMAEHEAQRGRIHSNAKVAPYESPFAPYEKLLGINIRNELIPLLGNEIAVSLPMNMFGIRSASGQQTFQDADKKEQARPSPLVAISIKDREAVRALIPKIVESIGFKGTGLLAQTERRDDTELVSYGNALSYAFIGDFIVASTDTAAVRHVVDSYLNHQTLASDAHFRNGTRWQPRQVLGQIYVSPALMESFNSFGRDLHEPLSEKMQEFLTNLNPAAEPVTYALSNEGFGPLHEVHIPKNLVMLMVAGVSEGTKRTSAEANEAIAQSFLRTISSAEATFQATKGKGRYGSLDELVSEGLLSKEAFDKYGYRIELRVSGTGFEATATPVEYGKTGKASFFLDESGVLRGGDHAGGPATIADKPME
jgi:Protein of unknown function (DUF3352)